MRGSIRKYGPSWAYRLELGRDHATGKRLQLQRGGFKTRRSPRRRWPRSTAAVRARR